MDNMKRDIKQENVQEREAADTNNRNDLTEDASLDSNPEPDSKSETTRKKNENDEKQADHLIKNVQDDITYENTPNIDNAYEENSGEGVSDENDTKPISKCDPCLFDEIEEKANAFCVVCVEYLCKGCARDHRKSKATRNHKLLLDYEIPKDPEVFKMMKSLACCSEHPDMEVSFQCRKHEKFICTKCLIASHMKCEDVSEASNVNRSFIGDETESSLSDMLKEVHDMTVSVRIGKEANIEKLHLDQVCVEKERSEFIKSLHEHLAKLDKNIKTETEEIVSKGLNALEEEVDKCKEIENQEIKYAKQIDVAMKYGNTVEVNVISELVKKEADNFKNETKQQGAKAAVRLKFERNESFTEVATIGNVFVLRGVESEGHQAENPRQQILLENSSDISNETPPDAGMSLQNRSLMQSTVSKKGKKHYLHQTLSGAPVKCSITSMLVLANGSVVVTDYNNSYIKLLNLDLSVKMEYKLDGEPIDMCQTSRDHLAVIFDGKKMVNKYIFAENIIHSDGGFQSKLYPISIEKSNENDTHVIILFSDEEISTPKKSDNDTIEIQIRNLHNGSIIKQLTGFRNKFSHKMILENPSRLRVMPKIQDVFLLSENKKLHCFDIYQTSKNPIKERWHYKSYKRSIIDEITDIAVDKEGNIYVCGKGSRNIHQISGSNFMHNRVLLSVSGTPLSICVDDERRRLFVGCENDGFIYAVTFE